MALATDEKDAYSSIKYSEGPRGYQSGSGKSKKTLKVVRIKKKYDIGDVFKEEVEEARSKEDELRVAKAIAAWKKAGGKVKKLPPGRKFQSLFGKGYKPKKQPRQAEEVEVDEADVMRYRRGKAEKSVDDKFKKKAKAHTGYELYHKDFSSAMQHAYKFAKSKGHIVDPKEIDLYLSHHLHNLLR